MGLSRASTWPQPSRVTLSPGELRLSCSYRMALRAPEAARLSINHDSEAQVMPQLSKLGHEADSFADSSDLHPMAMMRPGRTSTFAMSKVALKLRNKFLRAPRHIWPLRGSPRIAAAREEMLWFCGLAQRR
jgi:hypothetical protein